MEDQAARVMGSAGISGLAAEAVEHRFGAGRSQLEHRAPAVCAATQGGAIKIPLLIENHTRVPGIDRIPGLAAEAVEDRLRLSLRWVSCNEQQHREHGQ